MTSGIAFFLFPELLLRLFTWLHGFIPFVNPSWTHGVAFILFGFGAFTYAKHPEGIIEFQTTASIARTVAIVDRLRGKPPPDSSDELSGSGVPAALASSSEAPT